MIKDRHLIKGEKMDVKTLRFCLEERRRNIRRNSRRFILRNLKTEENELLLAIGKFS